MKQKLKNSIENKEKNKGYVGADDSVRPLLKRNTQRGITLVALVITIIVLLILAVVSIRIAENGGLITSTNSAVQRNTKESEKEAIQTGYAAYQVAVANGDNPKNLEIQGAIEVEPVSGLGWNIYFSNNKYQLEYDGNVMELEKEPSNAPDKLIEYLIGKNGKNLETILNVDGWKFIDDPNTIPNASKDIALDNFVLQEDSHAKDVYVYISYNSKKYNLKIYYNNDNEIMRTVSVNKIEELKGLEGKKATYNGNEYTILYDNEDGTVEMISNNTMGSLLLGAETYGSEPSRDDAEAQGNDSLEKAIYSYNNAITRLNNYCASLYKGDSNVISVRSVGSNPSNPSNENTTLYTSSKMNNLTGEYDGNSRTINGMLKSGDGNYKYDIEKMNLTNCISSDNAYWLASRAKPVDYYEASYEDFCNFSILCMNDGYIGQSRLVNIYTHSNNVSIECRSANEPVRPIIKISTSAIQIQ